MVLSDVQVQNSDVVTDQSATSNGDNNSVSQTSTNDTTQSQILLEMLLKAQNSSSTTTQSSVSVGNNNSQSQSSSFTVVQGQSAN